MPDSPEVQKQIIADREKFAPPEPPTELPARFLGAGKGDPVEGQRRYEATLAWRKEHEMDYAIRTPHPRFELITSNYPHYFHMRGKKNEPVWYERPAGVQLKKLREEGLTLDELIQHYAMVTDFGWQYLETDDLAKSITIIDLDGIRLMDFVGEVVDYTRKASSFTGQHYPDRCAYVLVINVPSWFKVIWNVVKNFVDEVTLKKIKILRGEKEIFEAMREVIPEENIPPEYGGPSMPLGQSPQEVELHEFMAHFNALAEGSSTCEGLEGGCKFCNWKPVRAY